LLPTDLGILFYIKVNKNVTAMTEKVKNKMTMTKEEA